MLSGLCVRISVLWILDTYSLIFNRGTGVGLVNSTLPAGEIVQEVRAQALQVIEKLGSTSTTSRV